MAGLSGNNWNILEGREAAVLSASLLSVLDEARGEKASASNGRVLLKIGCQGKRLGTPIVHPRDQLRRSSISQR